jgi:hypothetical protein
MTRDEQARQRVRMRLADIIADDLSGESHLHELWNSFADDEMEVAEQELRDIREWLLKGSTK